MCLPRIGFIGFVVVSLFLGCGGDDSAGDGQCGNGLVNAGEQCDDQNDNNDDECNNECRFSCGDGIVGALEACDTGIAAGEPGACPTDCDDGDSCTTDAVVGAFCEATCDSTVIDTFVDGDGCCPAIDDATAFYDFDCAAECGNGLVERGETCDTAIAAGEIGACPTECGDGKPCTDDTLIVSEDAGGACRARCQYTVRTVVQDGDQCCPPGATQDDDADCVPVAQCGNGALDAFFGETCDTAIAAGNEFACPTECVSEDPCAPSLFLSEGTCRAECYANNVTVPLDDDMCCPIEYGANNRNDNDCTSSCGTPAEECRFGEPFCDLDCRLERTAFRVTALLLKDPHIYFHNAAAGTCADLTDAANDSIFPGFITSDGDDNGFADLTILNVFKPLDQSQMENTMDLVFGNCLPSEDPADTECEADPTTARIPLTATNMSTGECLGVVADSLRASYNTPPTTPQGPCYVSDEFDGDLLLGSLTIPMQGAQIAAEYNADPATGLMNGLIRGFVSEAAADAALIPDTVALIGDQPLSGVLAGGIEPACTVSGQPVGDDRDVGPDGTTMGWWFYVNFTAAAVPFDDKPNASE